MPYSAVLDWKPHLREFQLKKIFRGTCVAQLDVCPSFFLIEGSKIFFI